MNINALLAGSTAATTGNASAAASSSSSSQATGAPTAVSQALSKVDQRVQADVRATTAQLSSFGLLKSAVSQSQVAAKAVANLVSGASESAVTQSAGDFFNAFNAAISAAQKTSTVSGSKLAEQSASRVSQDMKRALSTGAAVSDAMRKLGLKVQSDGSLSHDAQKFAAALKADPAGVRAALATVGKQVDAVASKELATSGGVGSAIASLNQHSAALTAQQKALLKVEQAMATASSSALAGSYTGGGVNGAYTGLGLSAYLSNMDG